MDASQRLASSSSPFDQDSRNGATQQYEPTSDATKHARGEARLDESIHLLGTARATQRLRPSPWWYIVLSFLLATARAVSMSPMVGLLTDILCDEYENPGNLPPDKVQLIMRRALLIVGVQRALMGVLSCLTAAWWGSLSDRYGRTQVIALCGLPFIDTAWLILALYRDWIPYYVIAIGYVAQGFAGGTISLTAVMLAYVADCTETTSRTVMFSIFLGAHFSGAALGGPLGRMLMPLVDRSSTIFMFSALVQICLSACSWLAIPESVSPEQIAETQRRHANTRVGRRHGGAMRAVNAVIDIARPLGAVLPERDGHANGRWNLTLLAAAVGSFNMVTTLSPYIALYSSRLGFPDTTITDMMRLTLLVRNICLVICCPLIVISLSYYRYAPALAPLSQLFPAARASVYASKAFALNRALACASAAFSAAIFVVIPLASTVTGMTATMVAGALGAGFNPAVLSLAVDVHAAQPGAREIGKLLGALCVVRAFCADILGQVIIAVVYMSTVATAPATLFYVASVFMVLALAALALVRMPERRTRDVENRVQGIWPDGE